MKEEAEAAVETAKGVLQDLVVVVSLVRTLTESFGSASDLYRKLKRKSRSVSRSSDDAKDEDGKRRHKSFRRHRESSPESDHERGRDRGVKWSAGAKKDEYSDTDEELIVTSSSQVLAEYDRGYRRLGEGFARGDLVTQIQLQTQIIQLQRTLLSIHQDYMLSTYLSPSSSHSHVLRLLQTTRSARMASIQALHMQYQRMLPSTQIPEREHHHDIPGAFPVPPRHPARHDSVTRRHNSRCRSRSRSPPPANDPGEISVLPYPKPDHGEVSILPYPKPRPKTEPLPQSHGNRLFCVYARDLQNHPRLPLTDNFKEGGNNMCPFCHAHTPMRPGKAWEIIANGCNSEGGPERRVFLVKNRFVIKCHRGGQGFACVLCARFKESDTVCRELGALMDHLWREHTSQELEKDDDIFEIDE
ncbi:hypothetical protein DE146DRAFT_433718 [Phaeosphaeria sp. MPI-PUGE-AT-0046c]|nr:hypothetical protein DE146DRAFT_433718 [Phaeosphaeria sp. MPI-PUGE-AT-0046c]